MGNWQHAVPSSSNLLAVLLHAFLLAAACAGHGAGAAAVPQPKVQPGHFRLRDLGGEPRPKDSRLHFVNHCQLQRPAGPSEGLSGLGSSGLLPVAQQPRSGQLLNCVAGPDSVQALN